MGAISFILGLILGSFLNVCIYRIPRGKSLVYPPSHCPLCKHRLSPLDNIPLISYILLRGRCRYCGGRISVRYPLVELLTGVFVYFLYLKFGLSTIFLIMLPFVLALIALSFIDFDTQRLPDAITIPIAIAGFILSFLPGPPDVSESAIGLAGGFVLMLGVYYLGKLLFRKEALGGGDVKLMAMVGAFLGIKGVAFSVFFGSVLGSIVGILYMMRSGRKIIPFGPFLSAGALIYLFLGDRLMAILSF